MTALLVLLLLFGSVHSACFKDKANQSTTWEWSGSIGAMHQGIDSSEKCLELCLDSYTCVATNYKLEERTCYLFNFMVKEETCLTPCKSMMIDLPVPESCQQIKNNVNPYHKRFLLESCLPTLELCKTTMKLKSQIITMDKNMERMKINLIEEVKNLIQSQIEDKEKMKNELIEEVKNLKQSQIEDKDKVNELKQTHREDKERLERDLNGLKQTHKNDKEQLKRDLNDIVNELKQTHRKDKERLEIDLNVLKQTHNKDKDHLMKLEKNTADKIEMLSQNQMFSIQRNFKDFYLPAIHSDPSWNLNLEYIPDFTDIEKTSANFLKESTFAEIMFGDSSRSKAKVKIYRSPVIQRFVRVENVDNHQEYIHEYDEDKNQLKEGIYRSSWPNGGTGLGNRLFKREGRKDGRACSLFKSSSGDIYYKDKITDKDNTWQTLAKHKFNPDNLTWTKLI